MMAGRLTAITAISRSLDLLKDGAHFTQCFLLPGGIHCTEALSVNHGFYSQQLGFQIFFSHRKNMLFLLLAVHLQAVLVALVIASRCKLPILSAGFICFALASLFEIIDHTQTDWIYVNRISLSNGLFYGALAAGLALLTAAVSVSRLWRATLLLLTLMTELAYALAGKGVTIALQSVLLVLFLRQWWYHFRDPYLWWYSLFGICLVTAFGTLLSISGDQFWHLFIGPCGSVSLLLLLWVLQRAKLA
ncbi:hypothetical protein OMCYN_01694 [cyanobiont of Ornithocercus magnificus]|nr:hypothetical protein OMCYN_01694 [cyanobiont of Ornithocercus magnificus]